MADTYRDENKSKEQKKASDLETQQQIDFKRAIQNLSDILIDSNKFKFMVRTLYDAMDTDKLGTLDCQQVEEFCREFLRGDGEYEINTDFENEAGSAYKMLRDNEKGRVSLDDLSMFLWELLRAQVVNLQTRIENGVFQRAENISFKEPINN